jgi:hypothetical protein
MKSGRQRRVERQAKKQTRTAKLAETEAEKKERERQSLLEAKRREGVAVNAENLAPNNSYSCPDFVQRGYYIDKEFTCQDCGREQIWTAAQQKWWYEVAKGVVWSAAIRCRACRRRARSTTGRNTSDRR